MDSGPPPATPGSAPPGAATGPAPELASDAVREGVTRLLSDLVDGDASAADALFPLLYDELRSLARRHLRAERPGHTLATTALVHEAYLRLVDQSRARFVNRAQFMGVASRVMRRVLIDHARRVGARKRGGGWERLELDDIQIPVIDRADSLVALDGALDRLAKLNPRLTRVVECRFFGGMTEEETASALGVTDRTVRRDWLKAKGWLAFELGPEAG